jgi:hypothetical protein
MIDPSFWEDEKLGECEPVVRLLFMGLISQADDDGRLKGHPSLLRSNIFPYDEMTITADQVDGWLSILEGHRLIRRYEVGRQKYIDVPNFKKHQTINKPQKSKLPEYYGSSTVVVQEDDGSDTAQKKLKEEKLKEEEVKGKGKEEEMPPPDNNPHKDRLLKLINECEITDLTLYELDIIFSYIGVCDIEVIEACIKKGQKKHINYAISTLKGKVKDGIIRKDQILPKPEVGEHVAKHEGQLQSGGAAAENKSITGGAVGWLPSKARSSDSKVVQLPQVSG